MKINLKLVTAATLLALSGSTFAAGLPDTLSLLGGGAGQANLQAVRQQIDQLKAAASQLARPSAAAGNAGFPAPVSAPVPTPTSIPRGGGVTQSLEASPATAEQIRKVPATGKPMLMQGSFIPTVLNMGINSDLASQLTAIVSIDIYDSVDGMTLLIPKGSRLVASVGGDVRIGQERLMVNFSRLIFPDGSYVMLPKMPGADAMGNGGLDAEVDNHFMKQFGAGLVMAVVSYAVQESTGAVSVTVNSGSATDALKTDVGEVLKEITTRILDRFQGLKPTLTVEPGTKVNLIVTADLLLDPYE